MSAFEGVRNRVLQLPQNINLVTNSKVNAIVVRIITVKRLPIVNLFFLLCFGNKKNRSTIGNLFNIMIRTITLTFELVTLNVVPNIYILGKLKHLIIYHGNIVVHFGPTRVNYLAVQPK